MEKKRNEERQVKHETDAALQEKCEQSMAQEQWKPKSRNSGTGVTNSRKGNGSPPLDVGGRLSASTTSSGGSGQRSERRRKMGHVGYLPCSQYSPVLPPSPMRELEGEREEASKEMAALVEGVVTPSDLNSVPWHHAQLYKMYGRVADYYIHPKLQLEQKKIVHPTLKSLKGHLGASHIWTMLRTDSKAKLYRGDQRFPQELKDAFSSHVREGVNKQKNPVFRNFTVTDDVPDLLQLMDQSLLRRIHVLRHKTELMYRSSQTNNDRAMVMLFNNPLPTVTEGEEGIGKYFPSWDDDNDVDSIISEPSFMKWLDQEKKAELWQKKKTKKQQQKSGLPMEDLPVLEDTTLGEKGYLPPVTVRRKHPESVLSPVGSEVSETLQDIWRGVMACQKPHRQPKYHFLTEQEARTQGAFLEKLGLDRDKLGMGHVDLLPMQGGSLSRKALPSSLKSLSALEPRSNQHSVSEGQHSSRSISAQHQDSRFQSQWQPLSMSALMEYKDYMATKGYGDFQYGRPHMWDASSPLKQSDKINNTVEYG